MGCKIEVFFTPAEFRTLAKRELTRSVCVVFDVLRATSTFVTALANGAEMIFPVEEIAEALALHRHNPNALLAGERNGLRIGGALAGGIEFDLGNSPREYTAARVSGKTIISTTTNGTRALRACLGADTIIAGSFLNLKATANSVIDRRQESLLVICAGTGASAALEDTLAAGALCGFVTSLSSAFELLDSAEIALRAFLHAQSELSAAVRNAQNARRLLAHEALQDDVEYCLRRDDYSFTATLGRDGALRKSD